MGHFALQADRQCLLPRLCSDSLSLIAGIIAYQIDRERTVKFLSASNVLLLTQSSQDPLTGVANRRELLSRLEVMLKQAQNTGQSIGILFIDLDNFKLINDQYGHDIGDLFLIEVASRLGSVLRPEDIIARYGGDEFVIAALGVDPVALKERLMHVTIGTYNLAEFSIMYAGPSIGVTQTKEDELDPVSVLARADQAMYEIKKSRKTQTK
ncbi:GGDEF domain-containing protein [Acidihalobacter prosperus]